MLFSKMGPTIMPVATMSTANPLKQNIVELEMNKHPSITPPFEDGKRQTENPFFLKDQV